MYETDQIEKMSKLVISALEKKDGKRHDVRLFSNKPEGRASAASMGYQQVTWADVIKFGEIKMEHSGQFVTIGDELAYMWRPIEMQEDIEKRREKINQAMENQAENEMNAECDKHGVKIITKAEMKLRD